MLNLLPKSYSRSTQISARGGPLLMAALILSLVFLQSACSGKKNKAVIAPPPEAGVVILPFNVPSGNQDLRWMAMAGPILMEKVSESARDLKVLPLWQTMPVAVEAAGASRSFTPDSAAYIASWHSVKWSAMGDISPTKYGVSMIIDFIPSRSSQVPFRYMNSGKIDYVGSQLPLAFGQFLYYLAVRPLEPSSKKLPTFTSMKSLAETLDREYGWFVEADPGKAQEVVTNLLHTDERLARFLFNPSLYPVLAQTK